MKPPVVYAAIGLPERLEQLRGPAAPRRLRRRVPPPAHDRRVRLGRGRGAARLARRRRPAGRVRRRSAWTPSTSDPTRRVQPEDDVVSVGADPRRDFELLARARAAAAGALVPRRRVGRQRRGARARCRRTCASRSTSRSRASASACSRARVVALPVRDNTYSGATTTLLQAMACGKPVVVTRTAAIARGYHLEDGVNCRLVPPGDLAALEHAVSGVLDDGELAAGSALRARETVERHLTWAGTRTRSAICSSTPPTGRRFARDASRARSFRARRARRSRAARELATEVDRVRYRRRGAADLALFHEFAPPPTGGGHQFLRALVAELERRGLVVEVNRISARDDRPACSTPSTSTSAGCAASRATTCRIVHRVDGPIGTYRGFDDGTDARIAEINARARGRDDRPVAVQPRRAPRARDRAREPRRRSPTPSIRRSSIRPAEREPLAGRRVRVDRDELVGQPEQGRRRARVARREPRPRALRADVRRALAGAVRAHPRRRRRFRPAEVADELRRHDVYLAAEPQRPVLERAARGARLRACRPSSARAAATPSSSATPACRSTSRRRSAEALDRLVAELDERRARDPGRRRSRRSPTATSRCSGG